MSSRFHLFFLMLIKKTKMQDGFKIFLHGSRDEKNLLRPSMSCKKQRMYFGSGVQVYAESVIAG